MAKKQFKTESKRLLDLMINSIYTNREIFLRELISNASDAIDKRHYLSLTDESYHSSDPYKIFISIDKENRTLSIEDNGVGMDKDELETNLGTIAHSGSGEFRKQMESNNEVDIIGQFGVGFYSSFMVGQKVIVESKKPGCDAYVWTSNGVDGYTIDPCDRDKIGTKITIYLREDTEDVKFSEYLDPYAIETLVKKYSDYIRYPIQMMVEKTVPKEGSQDEYETTEELKTLNSLVPLWRRNKQDITEDEYNSFYQNKFYDWEKPCKVIHYSLEGNVSYKALLFIPSRIPYDFYSKDFEAGLQLYSKGVFVMDKAKDLIPDYYSFVRGIIDTDDVSLNISREILQQNKQLESIKKSITKKVKQALVDMMINDRENYEKFFENFGNSLKYGVYENYGVNKDELKDLLIFKSSYEDKYVTLKEYCDRMKEGQSEIFYCTGASPEQIKKLPQMEQLIDKGYEVLYFTRDIDEFAIMMMQDYEDHKFKSAQNADSSIESEEEKKAKEDLEKNNENLLTSMKKALEGKVTDVRISSHLKSNPVCLVAEEGISMEMEKYLSQMPEGDKAKARKVLEINPQHEIFNVLQKIEQDNPDEINDMADLLYQQALLIEGFPVEDAVDFSNKICKLMKMASDK